MSDAGADGRIFTFYSYKGGTGRSMALANVAWILAAAGHRVLAIDWDMEAPGLHRYFHPFLDDPEAATTPGVIDFVTEFAMAATGSGSGSEQDEDWYIPYADLGRYAVSLRTDLFRTGATLDFIPAGRQGPAYAARVNSFDWHSFWERMGGAALFRAMQAGLRKDYDYILIDSRTGVSDTSGICTIALPDALVVAFTLNRQSIRGAAAVAQSVVAHRDRSRFRVYPVPMRVEFTEKDRLELARDEAQRAFDPLLAHVPVTERPAYWGSVEVVYHPYYAYEEVLAVFADRPERRTSLLAGFEQIASLLTQGAVSTAITPPETERREILARYQRQPERTAYESIVDALPRDDYVYVGATPDDIEFVTRLTEALESGTPPIRVWTPTRDLVPGESFAESIEASIRDAMSALIPVTGRESPWQKTEWTTAVEAGIPVTQLVVSAGALRPVMEVQGSRTIDFSRDFAAAVEDLRGHLGFLRSLEGRRATLTLQLEDARREVELTTSQSEALRHQVRIADLEAQLARLGSESDGSDADAIDELTLRVGSDDRIEARWRGAQVTSGAGVDALGRKVLGLMSRWVLERRLSKRAELETVGELLYATLFPGAVGSLLDQALESASAERRLRLVLSFDGVEASLADLPWECLLKPVAEGSPGVFLSTRSDLVMSRAIGLSDAFPAPRIQLGPARVLVGAWGPPELSAGAIAALDALSMPGEIEPLVIRDVDPAELLDAIEREWPAVVHLSAPVRQGPDGLEIEALPDVSIESGRLIHLMTGLEQRPPIVVLDLHSPAGIPIGHELAVGLAHLDIAAVLDVSSGLGTYEAEAFFKGFYEEVLGGRAVDAAVARGRRQLTRGADSASFAFPVLYMNHPGPVVATATMDGDARRTPGPGEAPPVDDAIHRRLRQSLESAQPWRTLRRVALEAAVSEETAANVLRADDDVRFSVGRSGNQIVGLISRVGA